MGRPGLQSLHVQVDLVEPGIPGVAEARVCHNVKPAYQLQISPNTAAIIHVLFTKRLSQMLFLCQDYLMVNSHYEYPNQKQDWIESVEDRSKKCCIHTQIHWVPAKPE